MQVILLALYTLLFIGTLALAALITVKNALVIDSLPLDGSKTPFSNLLLLYIELFIHKQGLLSLYKALCDHVPILSWGI